MLDPISLVLVVISLSVHEFAHALVADRLGDPTPRAQGRLTLNPLAHLDPLGTLALLFAGFGWGKPVQIDTYNLSSPRRDETIISLAGPISNFILAVLFTFLVYTIGGQQFFLKAIFLNLALGVFNLLPLWPLDGSKILVNILPFETGIRLKSVYEQYSLPLIVLFMLPLVNSQSLASLVVRPAINFLASFLLSF